VKVIPETRGAHYIWYLRFYYKNTQNVLSLISASFEVYPKLCSNGMNLYFALSKGYVLKTYIIMVVLTVNGGFFPG
jgi:hypothetical protein